MAFWLRRHGAPRDWMASSIILDWLSAAGRRRPAKRLMLPVSSDTLLRVVRRRARLPSHPLKVIGIDDWAWRRNHRYGSIICDLEQRRIVRLLADRDPATAQAWLADHPEIAIIGRDRGGGYGEAATKALPDAIQVADRWHLMENASRAFLDAVRKSMRNIRTVIGATSINPELLTCAERIQYEGYLHREDERRHSGPGEGRYADQADRAPNRA
jgi:transposase